MQIFEGEYLQAIGKANCGCKFLKESICKIEKREVADVYSCKLIEKSICKSSEQADADTTVLKKESARAFNELM